VKEGILWNNNFTSATCKAIYIILAATTPTPATTPKIRAILLPGAAAELATAAGGFLIAVDVEFDIVPELIVEVFIVVVAIIVDDMSDIMVFAIFVFVIMVSAIMVSAIMVSVIMVFGIVIVGVITSMDVGSTNDDGMI
jgi:hypothetical protein